MSATAPVIPVEPRPLAHHALVYAFVVVPFLAVIAGISLAVAGHVLSALSAGLAVGCYVLTGLGVTVGFHRYLTHGSFKSARPLRLALAVAGTMAVQGGPIQWVADHRRHHAFADRPGDPHSPWRFGTSVGALARGAWWAHTGWLFERNRSARDRYAPDLLADPALVAIEHNLPWWIALSLLGPAVLAFAVTGGSWAAAGGALLWAGLVRVFLLHHVTWSINSICHIWGQRPFRTRDRSTNVWPLALLSFGESWHNLHHADPTCARHGVDRGQIDLSARLIRWFERAGWVWDVRWPVRQRLATRRAGGPDDTGLPESGARRAA